MMILIIANKLNSFHGCPFVSLVFSKRYCVWHETEI